MSKPVLAIDFDDTLTFNAQLVVEAYNRSHNASISLNDVYVAEKFGNPAHGWHHTSEEAIIWIREFLLSDEGLANPPLPGTEDALRQLNEQYELIVVTGRSQDWSAGTETWLDRFLPGLFAGAYYSGEARKPALCQQMGAGIMIDDNPADLGLCVGAGIRGILFGSYPWNQKERIHHKMTRAKNWVEVERMLLP